MREYFQTEEIFQQNSKRINYYKNQLHNGFRNNNLDQKALYEIWNPYGTYNPNEGPMGIYLNYIIRKRMAKMQQEEDQIHQLPQHAAPHNINPTDDDLSRETAPMDLVSS